MFFTQRLGVVCAARRVSSIFEQRPTYKIDNTKISWLEGLENKVKTARFVLDTQQTLVDILHGAHHDAPGLRLDALCEQLLAQSPAAKALYTPYNFQCLLAELHWKKMIQYTQNPENPLGILTDEQRSDSAVQKKLAIIKLMETTTHLPHIPPHFSSQADSLIELTPEYRNELTEALNNPQPLHSEEDEYINIFEPKFQTEDLMFNYGYGSGADYDKTSKRYKKMEKFNKIYTEFKKGQRYDVRPPKGAVMPTF